MLVGPMPFWGLVVTSLGFAVPSILAFHKRRLVTATSCGVITLTSLAYHGTQHPIAHKIDLVVAHTVGAGWAIESARRAICVHKPADIITCIMTFGSMSVYLLKSRNNFTSTSRLWHMAFHTMSQGAWCIYIIISCKQPINRMLT